MCHLRGRFKVLSGACTVHFRLSHWTKIILLTCFIIIIIMEILLCGHYCPVYLYFWDAIYTGISSLPIDIERSARVPVNLKISIMARSPSIPPSPHPSRPCWTVMVASSHVWVHTLHWAMLFNYLRWSPRWKYIAHISEAKCLGQTHWEIKYTLCHLIWQLSFPSYWIEVVTCTAVVLWLYTVRVDVCSQCRCVYESSYSCWDLTVWKGKIERIHTQHPGYIIHLSGGKNNIALITSSSPVWKKPQGLGFTILYK